MELLNLLTTQAASMHWSDFLDIALTAFLIYKILPVFKAEGTRRIALAVAFVIVLAGVTELLQLYTINFILNQFMTVGIVAIVVLFQPELRRMLDRLFSVRLRNLLGTARKVADMDAVVAQTVVACEDMSAKKIGALIVFTRDDRLDEVFRTGTRVDAVPSEQLIRNIFFPKAALHDGAMIIRDGRVAAAGCVLPLSESSSIPADLGTRHRAGIGISELSDALVVIVSEETGTISVAEGGGLKRPLTAVTLEKLLRQKLCPEENETDNSPVARLRRKLADQVWEGESRHEK